MMKSFALLSGAVAFANANAIPTLSTANIDSEYVTIGEIKIAQFAGIIDNDFYYQGMYDYTWTDSIAYPNTTNMIVSFSGWSGSDIALQVGGNVSTSIYENWMSIGGGNSNGAYSDTVVNGIVDNLEVFKNNGYDGIVFDIEECMGSLDLGLLKFAYRKAKDVGMKTMLTIPHSGPYGCVNSAAIVQESLASEFLDIISPQFYHQGDEVVPDFDAADNIPWSVYKTVSNGGFRPDDSSIRFMPSIVDSTHLDATVEFMEAEMDANGRVIGYFQWSNNNDLNVEGYNADGSNLLNLDFTKRCGDSFESASARCFESNVCQIDADCGSGEQCFGQLETDKCQTTLGLFPDLSVDKPAAEDLTDRSMRCGSDYKTAFLECDRLCLDDSYCNDGEVCVYGLPEECEPPAQGNLTDRTMRCGIDEISSISNCDTLCLPGFEEFYCSEGELCHTGLDETCDPNANITYYSTRCGATFADANEQCSDVCSIDGDCPAGQSCFAEVDVAPCSRYGNGATTATFSIGTITFTVFIAALQMWF